MTYSLERKLPSYNGSMYQTCYKDLNEAFDECIQSEVSIAMKKRYNCTPPFYPYDGKRLVENLSPESECKINRLTKTELVEYRDTFLGNYLSQLVFLCFTEHLTIPLIVFFNFSAQFLKL